MIYNLKTNHTGSTENVLLGHAKQANGFTYRVHSCKITNHDSTDVYIHVKIHDGTAAYDILNTFLIKKGYSIELFEQPFDYPDKFDLMLALTDANWNIDWITKTEVLDKYNSIET